MSEIMFRATMAWRVYGREGHRQRVSFGSSYKFATHNGEVVTVLNSDYTGTNDYTKVIITATSFNACKKCFEGQLSDGIFENSRVGKIVEVGV